MCAGALQQPRLSVLVWTAQGLQLTLTNKKSDIQQMNVDILHVASQYPSDGFTMDAIVGRKGYYTASTLTMSILTTTIISKSC